MPRHPLRRRNAEWRRRLWRPGVNRCCWCFAELGPAAATLEHLVPVRDGGRTGPGNVALACADCNTVEPSEARALYALRRLDRETGVARG